MLSGVAAADFGEAEAQIFKRAIAASCDAVASADDVSDVEASSYSYNRRRLSAGGAHRRLMSEATQVSFVAAVALAGAEASSEAVAGVADALAAAISDGSFDASLVSESEAAGGSEALEAAEADPDASAETLAEATATEETSDNDGIPTIDGDDDGGDGGDDDDDGDGGDGVNNGGDGDDGDNGDDGDGDGAPASASAASAGLIAAVALVICGGVSLFLFRRKRRLRCRRTACNNQSAEDATPPLAIATAISQSPLQLAPMAAAVHMGSKRMTSSGSTILI